MKVVVLILLALVATVLARCNNNCNGHGQCVSNNCVCNQDWAGDDCSLSVRTLTSGSPITSNVDMWEWEYFKIDIKKDSNFVLEMNQLDTRNADCDIYARRGSYPTHLRWDWRDISLAQNVRHEFDQPEAGTWYFGVVGFLSCNYTIKVTVVGSCLQGCNGNGDCIEGACFCNPGWSGDACQNLDVPLTIGQWTTGTVVSGKWAFFHVRLTQPAPELTFELQQTQTSPDYDVDLYIRHESAPTMIHWDYANGTTDPNTVLKIADAITGFWYAGVYAFKCNGNCDFRIRASLTGGAGACPDQCSMHGNCNNGVCNCFNGYTGEYCETKTSPLALGEQVAGLVGDQTWNYYSFASNSLNPIVVSVAQQPGSTGDCDLFIRSDVNPTRFAYDYFDIGVDANFNITIPQPGNTNWRIGVFGFSRCQYTLTVSSSFPSGDCLNGGSRPISTAPCVCPAGFSGQQCEIRVAEIRADTKVEGTLTVNQWSYFNFTLTSYSTNIYIAARELDTDARGDVWLFASNNFAPTIHDHDFANTEIRHLHTIHIHRPAIVAPPNYRNSIIIGVYGSPFITKANTRFALVAWATPF